MGNYIPRALRRLPHPTVVMRKSFLGGGVVEIKNKGENNLQKRIMQYTLG